MTSIASLLNFLPIFSNDRACFIFELDALHRGPLEGVQLHGLLIKRLQRRLEQIVRVGFKLFKLLTHIRSRCPAWLEPRGENLALVGLEIVILVFSLLDGGVEGCGLAVKTLLSRFGLEVGPGRWEKVRSFPGRFKSLRMQTVVDSLVVAARQQIDTVNLRVGQLVRRQPLDVLLEVVGVIRAVAPWLLGRLRLFR